MLSQMPAIEIIEWQAFYSLEGATLKNKDESKKLLNELKGKRSRR